MQITTRTLTWRKRIAFNALMVLGICLLIESITWVVMPLLMGSPRQLVQQRQAVAAQNPFVPGGSFVAPGVIHPYIGAVLQPKDIREPYSPGNYRVTEFGFIDDDLPIHKRSPQRLIVGILGGSVARQFSVNAPEVLAQELSRIPEFQGKEIKIVRLASNGYKQPQQLMIINYLCTLGAEFDILINLDGFNEAVLPSMDNIPFGVHSVYPRDWGKLIAGTASPEYDRMGGYVTYLRSRQQSEAAAFGRIPWRYSNLALMLWAARKNRSDQAIMAQTMQMSRFSEAEQTYCGSGPPEHFKSTDELYEHCIVLWSRSSMLLHHLCAAQGIRYFHFLQPNQYLPDSKPIGQDESSVAMDETSPHSRGVRACFPRMQTEGQRMARAGVLFRDLTRVFADHPEPIYIDKCCHVTEEGDVLMAKAIAAAIRDRIAKPTP
jgi:hypothetical protein